MLILDAVQNISNTCDVCICNQSSEYISIILGGTYTISMIGVTILSLVSNVINNKILNIKILKFKRYNILVIFSPLIILHLLLLLPIFLPATFDNIYYTYFVAIIIIAMIIIQTFYVLEIFYNEDKFKKSAIKRKIASIQKSLKKKNYLEIEEIISVEMDLLAQSHKSDNKDKLIIFTKKDIGNLFEEYIRIRNNNVADKTEKFSFDVIEYAKIIYDKEEFYKKISCFEIDSKYILEYLIKDIGNDPDKLIETTFDKMYEYYRSSNGDKTFKELYLSFVVKILELNKLDKLVSIIFNDKWNIADSEYLSLYVKDILYLIENYGIEELSSDKSTKERLKMINDKYKKVKSKSSKNVVLDSIIILIRKEEEE